MKKLIIKDKKIRHIFHKQEKERIILKTIFQNFNFFTLVRWNAFLKLQQLGRQGSEITFSNRCVYTINRKRLNKK